MSIKQQGGVFGRNPTFNDVEVEGNLTVDGEQIPAASNIAKLDTANTFTQRQTVSGTYSVDSVWTGASSAGVGGAFRAVQDDGAAMASGDRIGYLIWGGAYDGASSIGYNGAISAYATENWNASARGTEVIIQTTDNGSTGRNNRLTVKNDGTVEISKNLKITTSGNGIDFSATAGTGTSELLDDYEEGAWTVNYAPTTGAFTTITTVGTGRYTKVGRLVTVFGSVRTSGTLDVTGASGNLKITGLPYACNATLGGGGADISHQSWNLGIDILNTRMSVAAGASEILMNKNTMNGSSFPSGNITVADMSTSGGAFSNLITFTASYEV